MDDVFVSSIIRGFEEVRTAAREAIESLRLRPVMAEFLGASSASPQRALLDEVAQADVFLLLIGSRYGEPGPSGRSPTEDEFDEAQRRGKPILVLVQETEREPEQQAFLERVRGRWQGGRLSGSFSGAADVGLAVVRAISNLREADRRVNEFLPAAQVRALDLAGQSASAGSFGGQARARVVLVPVGGARLLSTARVQEPRVADEISRLSRQVGLVPQRLGISPRTTGSRVTLIAGEPSSHEGLGIVVEADGAVAVEGPVSGDDEFFGSMRIHPSRLSDLVDRTAALGLALWQLIDQQESVQYIAAVVAVPDAQNRVFGEGAGRSTISLGGSFHLPADVRAPDPPLVIRREKLADSGFARGVVGSVRAIFLEAQAVDEP